MTLTEDEQKLLKDCNLVRDYLVENGLGELAKPIEDTFITPLTDKLLLTDQE